MNSHGSSRWWLTGGLTAAVILVATLPLLLRAIVGRSAVVPAGAEPLVIVSPHNEQIRYEFAHAFNVWRQAHGLSPVAVDWRSWGGTSDLRKGVLSELAKLAQQGRENEGLGYDLFFGGGDYDLGLLAKGVRVQRGGQEVWISATVPVQLPPGLLQRVFPTPDIGGAPLYSRDLRWVGTALSSFGIVYNRDVVKYLGLSDPTTWADLADPRYQGWVALADPAHSGSVMVTYDTILRRLGWRPGWKTLRRVFANARYFTDGAAKVPVDVSAGEAAAGMCIDFYGRYQSGAIADGRRVGYVDPPFMTAITADPISILRGAPHKALANQFVIWTLSKDAQGLWQRRVGVPGGPVRYELRRLPVRRDMYTPREMALWRDQVNPFTIAKPLPADMPSFNAIVPTLSHAIAIDILPDLKQAWAAINRQTDAARKERMLALFDALPPELQHVWPPGWDEQLKRGWSKALSNNHDPRHAQVAATPRDSLIGILISWAKDKDQRPADQLRWMIYFRDQYRKVLEVRQDKPQGLKGTKRVGSGLPVTLGADLIGGLPRGL